MPRAFFVPALLLLLAWLESRALRGTQVPQPSATRLLSWRKALLILQPETLLDWHRQGFGLFWRVKSRARRGRPLPFRKIGIYS